MKCEGTVTVEEDSGVYTNRKCRFKAKYTMVLKYGDKMNVCGIHKNQLRGEGWRQTVWKEEK